jgi:hypothetical protein
MKKILALMVLGAFSMVTFAAVTTTDDTKKEETKKKKRKKKADEAPK